MSTISQLLNTGASALRINQLGINVTGNNIANVNTEGYSRQRLTLADNTPTGSYLGQYGTGVRSVSVDRVFDRFLRGHLINGEQELGKWNAMTEALGLVEGIFTETQDSGIAKGLDDFWNAWQSLSSNPSGYAERSDLAAKTQSLAEMIQGAYGQLEDMEETLNTDIDNSVSQVNQLTARIADLNQQIQRADATGQGTADLADTRDRLISELAGHIDFTMETSGAMIDIHVGSGVPLVAGTTGQTISFDGTSLSVGGTAITGDVEGGRIGAMLSAKGSVAGYQGQLNTLASGLISEVNAIHSSGYGLDNSRNDFFGGTDASDIELNPDLVVNVNKIAAGDQMGAPGDNSVSLAISDFATKEILGGGTQTFGEFYSSLVQRVGSDLSQARTLSEHQTAIVSSLQTQRESISGVSLDEEMVNLMKYQHGYEAASKLITTADEMLQTLMDMI